MQREKLENDDVPAFFVGYLKLALSTRHQKSQFFGRDLSHTENTVRLLTALKYFDQGISDSEETL